MFDSLTFIHLFVYPFMTGIIFAGSMCAVIRELWLIALGGYISSTICFFICVEVLSNYYGYMG